MDHKEGQAVPQVVFHTRDNDQWVDVSTDALFSGKTVIVFSLPGAFTPTCSSTHLPRYDELAPVFFANGVDDILCVSVNDSFVMNAWSQDQGTQHVRFVPDGSGKFTEGMGMLVPKDDLGFGMRSWRYSMLVRDGVVEKMFIEPNKPGDPFEVSDADTMLRYLAPDAALPKRITVFSKPGCPHCGRAKAALDSAGLRFEEVVLGTSGITFRTLAAVAGRSTAPQVFADGKLIGSADEVQAWIDSKGYRTV